MGGEIPEVLKDRSVSFKQRDKVGQLRPFRTSATPLPQSFGAKFPHTWIFSNKNFENLKYHIIFMRLFHGTPQKKDVLLRRILVV
jgi:hypothetical protein